MTTPLELNAAPSAGFDQPFELLAACHQRVLRMLQLLLRLQAHLGTKGADPEAGRAALDVMRYFDIAGPAHHEDEERHVFPRLRDAGLGQLAERLQLEHLAMAEAWNGVRRTLSEVVNGQWDREAIAQRWPAFDALYRAHVDLEETIAFPAAARLADAAARQAMGQEMAERRGLKT